MKTGNVLIIVLGLLVLIGTSASGLTSPRLSANPAALNFGRIDFGITSEKKVTIRNRGNSDVVIGSIEIAGANPSDFGQTNDCVTIPPGNSCAITVKFAPTAAGKRSGIINLYSSDDPGNPTVRVKLSGRVDAAELPIAATGGRETSFSAAFDGTNYLVGIQGDEISDTSVTAQLVPRSGVLDTPRISTGGSGSAPVVAFDQTNYLLVWSEGPSPSGLLNGQFISQSGDLVGSTFMIGAGTDIKTYKSLFDGTNYFVVWDNDTSPGIDDTSDIYGQFVTPSGQLLGPSIAVSTEAHGQRFPALAFDEPNILVTWADGRNQSACETTTEGTVCYESDIFGQFISKSAESTAGTLSGPNFPISTSRLPRNKPMSVAFDGENYFVGFSETTTLPGRCPSTGCKSRIYGQFVATTGISAGRKINIATAAKDADNLHPVLVFNGAYYLMTWTNGYGTKTAHVRGRFFDTSGRPLSGVFLLASVARSNNNSGIPAKSVALSATPLFDGTNYFWIINRGKPGKNPKDFAAYTDVDVYITIGPGPSQSAP